VGARLLVGPGLGDGHAAEVGHRRRAARRVPARVRRVQGIPRAGDDERQAEAGTGVHGRAVPRRRRHVVVERAVCSVVGVLVQGRALLLLDAGRLRGYAGAGSPPLDGLVRGALHRYRKTSGQGNMSQHTRIVDLTFTEAINTKNVPAADLTACLMIRRLANWQKGIYMAAYRC